MKIPKIFLAISVALIIFICFHYFLTVGINYLANNSVSFPELLPWLNLIAYLLYILSGFVASILSDKKLILIGLVSGFLSATSAILIFSVANGELLGILITLCTGLVLGGVGGSILFFFRRKSVNIL